MAGNGQEAERWHSQHSWHKLTEGYSVPYNTMLRNKSIAEEVLSRLTFLADVWTFGCWCYVVSDCLCITYFPSPLKLLFFFFFKPDFYLTFPLPILSPIPLRGSEWRPGSTYHMPFSAELTITPRKREFALKQTNKQKHFNERILAGMRLSFSCFMIKPWISHFIAQFGVNVRMKAWNIIVDTGSRLFISCGFTFDCILTPKKVFYIDRCICHTITES